jgi:hypothetical protein
MLDRIVNRLHNQHYSLPMFRESIVRKKHIFAPVFSLAGLVLILAACGQTSNGAEVAVTHTSPEAIGSKSVAAPIDDEEAAELLSALSDGSTKDAQAAIDRIMEVGDERFVAVLIELLRAEQVRIVDNLSVDDYVSALEGLTGQPFDILWIAWVEWYAAGDLIPPPGFASWKGQMLAKIDPRFADFLQDDHHTRISVEEIQWGGVTVDGLPPLDNPAMIPAGQAGYLNPEDAVFGVVVNNDARAYPLRIMDWHEMANDNIGGVPMSLAYCTLCGAAIAYDTRPEITGYSGPEPFTFSTSGLLFRSNKLMYDRQTNTLWNQLTGEPVIGELAGEEIRLGLLPVVLTSWEQWLKQHPDSQVLDIHTGFGLDYSPGVAYGSYFNSAETVYPVGQRSNQLGSKEQIYALRVNEVPKAYALNSLIAEEVVNDTLGETTLVLISSGRQVNVAGTTLLGEDVIYSAGAEVRAYERGQQTFSPGPEEDLVLDSSGQEWQVTEGALIGPDDQRLPRLNGHLSYWFGWYAFFPNTLVYPEG